MPQYSKAIKKMAVDFGEGTVSLSKGLYDILSASIAPAKALDVLAVAAKAAKAGLTTTAVAADAITTILNAYRLSADKAANISDILFATVKRGKLTFEELAQSIGKVAATAAVAGLSFEEVSAAIATMTRSGLNAFLATTALRSIISGFLKPMESAKKAAAGLGIELNSTTLRTIGLTGVLEKLKDASPELLAALIPNRRALAGFAAMIKNTSGQLYDLNLMMNSAGLTQKAYEKMTSTLKFKLDKLKQSFVILAVTIGETMGPAFETLTEVTIDATKKIHSFVEKNKYTISEWAEKVVTWLGFVKNSFVEFVKWLSKDWGANIRTALEATVPIWVALGISIKRIFKDIWEDFYATGFVYVKRTGAMMRDYFSKWSQLLKFYLSSAYPQPMTFAEAIKKATKAAGVFVGSKYKKGGYEKEFPFGELKSVDELIKNIGKDFTDAWEKMLALLPDDVKDPIEKHFKETQEIIAAITEKYERMRTEIAEKAGGPTGGLGGAPGAPGAPGAAEGGGRIGFVGFREAWGALAQSLQRDKTQENLLRETINQGKTLDNINDGIEDLDFGMS